MKIKSQSLTINNSASVIVKIEVFFPAPPWFLLAVAVTPSLHSNSNPSVLPTLLIQVGLFVKPSTTIFLITTSEIFLAQAFSSGS